MRFPVAVALLALAGCSAPHRTLAIVPTLPGCIPSAAVNTVRLTALGDFAALPGLTASASAMQDASLALPRETRVIDVEGFGPTGLAAFGRTAPLTLDDVAGGAIGIAYGPPDGFCATAQLNVARIAPRATLLGSGAVLVSGGYTPAGPVTAMELYLPDGDGAIPKAGFRLLAATLDEGAALGHAVAPLPDGGVLISGGVPFDPRSRDGEGGIAFQGALRLDGDGVLDGKARVLPGSGRAEHSATTLRDGRVLLAGGCAEFDRSGACASGRVLATTLFYDPVADSFTAGPDLLHARWGHSAVLRGDGSVLIVGGVGEGGAVVPAEVFDPAEARGFDAGPSTGAAVPLPTGSVLLAGDTASSASAAALWLSATEMELPIANLPPAATTQPPLIAPLDDGGALVVPAPAAGSPPAAWVFDGRSGLTPLGAALPFDPGAMTRLADGTVLLVGSRASQPTKQAALYFRSPLSTFANLPPLTLDGPGDPYLPRRPDRAVADAGQLIVTATSPTGGRPAEYALIAGMQVTDFDLDLLLGRRGSATAALIFGWQSEASYFFLTLAPRQPVTLAMVSAVGPGETQPSAVSGCSGAILGDGELPDGGTAHAHLAWRDGLLVLTTTRTLLSCRPPAPPRGQVGVGALDGVTVFSNLSLSR